MIVRQYDIEGAFLNGPIQEDLYVRDIHATGTRAWRLRKSLYGTNRQPTTGTKCWTTSLKALASSSTLTILGSSGKKNRISLVASWASWWCLGRHTVKKSDLPPRRLREPQDATRAPKTPPETARVSFLMLYYRHSDQSIIVVHVDDLLCSFQSQQIEQHWLKEMGKHVTLEERDRLARVLGMDVEWTQTGARISGAMDITKLANDLGINRSAASPLPLPMQAILSTLTLKSSRCLQGGYSSSLECGNLISDMQCSDYASRLSNLRSALLEENWIPYTVNTQSQC